MGPVKTQFGYYVFKVTAITPASQQTPGTGRTTRSSTSSARSSQQNTLNKFVGRSTERATRAEDATARRTTCRRAARTLRSRSSGASAAPPAPPAARLAGRARRLACSRSTRSRAACAATAPGTASRTSARSSRTRWRRPTSWPTPRNSGDDAKLLDELGDVLFQVYFLSLLLEERGQGDLAAVADHCRQKLIRRHPHVFGDAEAEDAATVLRNWDQIKRAEPERGGDEIFHDVPENLPSHALRAEAPAARRVGSGYEHPSAERAPGSPARATRRPAGASTLLGDLLFDCVALPARPGWIPSSPCERQPTRFRRGESSERDQAGPRPPDHRQPRATRPSRSRSGSSSGAAGPRRGARRARPPASSRRSSCATAASRSAARA